MMTLRRGEQGRTTKNGSMAISANGKRAMQSSGLDLTSLPPIYVLATHLSIDEQHETEELLSSHGATLTYDIREAQIVLGNILKPQRAKLELRWKGLRLDDVRTVDANKTIFPTIRRGTSPAKKKRKVITDENKKIGHAVELSGEDSTTASETHDEEETDTQPMSQLSISKSPRLPSNPEDAVDQSPLPGILPVLLPDTVIVVKLEWLNAAVSMNMLVPVEPFVLLSVRVLPVEKRTSLSAKVDTTEETHAETTSPNLHGNDSNAILERARADPKPKAAYSRFRRRDRVADAAQADFVGKTFSSSQVPQLLHQTTSEDNETRNDTLPPMPDWVLQNKIYSCERSTPLQSLNADFIQLLKRIRLVRELTLDEIGVRAYSTSIASLSAYPYHLRSSREVHALPGCDSKIAQLFHEYHTTGQLQAVRDIDNSPALTSLQAFHQIWGVGAVTAREFYYEKGWRDLDDIIEHGWRSLTRVQQIGLKYYDEFQAKLTRTEVEAIGDTITRHAALVTDDRVQTALVGGYRRGQLLSSDVDMIVSHPDEMQTLNLVTKLVASLEAAGCITHTLTLNLTTSHRDQATLPIHPMKGGHGFDTLDKALVVWQWPLPQHSSPSLSSPTTTTSQDRAKLPQKNPNPHHRVDIIISPWRTIGCAIAGWTSGTTFQRDLRRYSKHVKNWKFDSSGVRERGSGIWVDLEGWRDEGTRCTTWLEAEKRVFDGLGLEWREPWERCTG